MNKKSIRIMLVFLLFLTLLSGCSKTEENKFQSLSDFETAKIGIATGSSHDKTIQKLYPEAERVYFNTMADMILAVEQGKIDAYIEDAPFIQAIIWEGANVEAFDEPVTDVENGFVFPQEEGSRYLREQVNAFFEDKKKDGTIDHLYDKWMGESEPTKHPDYKSLTGENGTIKVAVSIDNKPLLYKYEDQCTGFEMDLLTLFGKEYGYAFEIEEVPFESVITGIAAGKYDMAASSLNITAEREESVDFSIPYKQLNTIFVVAKEEKENVATIQSVEDLKQGTIGVLTGSVYASVVEKLLPEATIKYYSSHADMIVSLEQGKIDAVFEDNTIYTTMRWEYDNLNNLEDDVYVANTAFIFAKENPNEKLLNEINAFIKQSKEDGTTKALEEKWLSEKEPTEYLDYSNLTGENGTLKIAVGSSIKPMTYVKEDFFTGYEIEFLTLFAKQYGYKLDFQGMAFDALIPAVSTGKCDFGASGISITEERKQAVTFSDVHMNTYGKVIFYEENDTEEVSFIEDVKESFEKTFIRENRWKMILQGIGITMLISVCSALFGTLLGFGLYMLSRSDSKVLQSVSKAVAKVYSRIVAGTPVVVILMILFYVVFGSVRDMSGVVVAIIGFSLTFGAFVYDHMRVSVNSVDKGQTEAAYALGYTKNQTFFRVIFPQAMNIFLPSYCGQAVDLIKATAVVGYIAVNDLTKMGDIIRSNTYEAFFPLIATAIIYFILTWIVSLLLNTVKYRFEPKRRSKEEILKGVKTS